MPLLRVASFECIRPTLLAVLVSVFLAPHAGAEEKADPEPLPVVLEDNFEEGAQNWEMLDPKSWRISKASGNRVLSQPIKAKSYDPPHRSPHHVALVKGPIVGDFELTVRVRSTHQDYNHRDACLFFGYQDAARFYYVHLGKRTDPHANQIFIVNESDRKKISTKTTDGTPWDDKWHTVRVVRKTSTGHIAIYWDDQEEPIMTAQDKTFLWGRVGVGSFDDTADWDDFQLRGVVPKPEVDQVDPISPYSGSGADDLTPRR